MEPSFFKFVWRYSRRDQLIILALTFLSFPLVYISLEIPKIIINDAISGTDFPIDIFGLEFEQIPYLFLMCGLFLLMVVAINAIKWFMNVQVGMTGERMLRRLRYMLFERVMRFRMSRFRRTKPGEVIQSIMGEIDPLGGFIGEVIATPCFQGGLLIVYTTFIFVQDWVLGLAAISLYPLQAWLIPKLQARIVRLNKERAGNSRALADTIGESINLVGEIHTNDTARWHLAQTAGRLYSNTRIRLAIFKRKFTIKFINNFMNQLTPFFFYSAGGYLVIKGDLDFGSLVAVLAAYKDVAAPWKAVLNYVQRWSDFNSRYSFVIENFSGDDVMPPDRIYAEAAAAEALSGTLEFVAVEGGPGTGGLTVPLLRVPQGTMVAVQGGSGGGREALLRMAAGVQEPADGRVSFGGSRLIEASLPQIGASIAFVSAEPGLVSKSVRENLLYGLYRGAPDLAQQSDVELLMMLDEARRTGNTTADPMGDWVDFGIADVEGAAELDVRLIDLVETVSLSSEVYSDALNMRLDPRRAEEWSGPIMRARDYLRDSGVDLSDLVEDFDTSGYNRNATLLENVLFALPVDALEEHGDYARHRAVMDVLTEAGAEQEMIAIGWDIASEFSELVDTLDGDSSVLDSFSGYSKADIMAAHDLVIASAGQMPTSPKSDDKILLISLAFEFTEVRDRLDVIDDERRGRLLKIRDKSREIIRRRSDFVSFDEERFSPARRVAENILHGERRHDRRSAWKRLEEEIERAVRAAGLRDDMIRLGLTRQLGSSSGLTSAAKRKIALVRALLKRPNLLVLDGIASTESEADAKLRSAIRLALPGTTIIYAASNQGATEAADLLATIGDNGYIETTKTDAAPGS